VNNNQNWVFSVVSGFDIDYHLFRNVPGPATLALVGLAVVGLGTFSGRRRCKSPAQPFDS
jgi:hypothetical protein